MVMTSRFALEGLLQNRLGAGDACKNSALRMRESASDLFHLYAGKHHQTDDTSSSSCYGGGGGGADVTMTAGATTIKRESHTPTTSDQSDDSGVDVCGAAAEGGNAEDGRGRSYNGKRKRSDDDDDSDGGGDCPSAAKSSRTTVAGPTTATATVLSVNVQAAACPPFRPWSSSDESSSDAGLCRMMFHDIRNVDRIMTLEQQRRLEQQPLDLTKGRRDRRDVVPARTEERETAERVTAERVAAAHVTVVEQPPVTDSTDASPPPPPPPPPPCSVATTAAGARYSKNMSRARRIEANARERSRVHTISAAFDTLRSSIPSYSRNQKLSKLSTIRIASAYILTLSRLLDMDYSAEQDSPSVDECVDNVTGIIHMEGKARKKRDEQQQQY